MAIAHSRPKYFDDLKFEATSRDIGPSEREVTWTAPCGCCYTNRRRNSYPIGVYSADGTVVICNDHTEECDSYGQQTWPHDDCIC